MDDANEANNPALAKMISQEKGYIIELIQTFGEMEGGIAYNTDHSAVAYRQIVDAGLDPIKYFAEIVSGIATAMPPTPPLAPVTTIVP